MDPAVKLAARSLNGCWTCRVRKKKCDETRPVCRSCSYFGLECHGYGPRPEWMDNGRLQKEQAAKFKHIVSQRKSSARKERQTREARSSQDFNQSLGPVSTEDAPTHIASSFMDPTWGALPNYDYVATVPQSLVSEEHHQHPSAFFRNMDSTQSSLSPGSSGDLSWLAPDMMGVHDVKAVRNAILPQDEMGFATNGRSLSMVDEWAWDSSSNGNGFPSQASVSDYAAGKPTAPGHFMASGNDQKHRAPPEALIEPVRHRGAEDTLFMHYLDRVFYIQFPFYLSRNPRGRVCLFSILRMVKPAYLATLALGERELLSAHPQQGDVAASLSQLRAKGGYYDLAAQGTQRLLQESHTWDRSAHIVHNIESLASILQLLFWELFAGGRGNWQVLLRDAARLIPGLLEARTPLTKPKLSGSDYTNPPHHIETPSPDDHRAISVLLGSFISLDIIASASTRRAPFLNIDHAQALRNPCISLESIMGCSNSVMGLIFEISSLDRWKEESQAVRKLSIIDLAERGRQIEERLRQELVDMDALPETGPSLLNRSAVLSAPADPDVNRLFALSALIYLHVVISGAHPELPEIADAVSQTIAVFKRLWDPRLLQSVLVWPFCVSGCLALGEQQNFFRNLFSAAEITESTVGTCFEAFRIMEKCWEARRSGPFNCDWASIMKQQGYYVLLR
ncbi:Zn(II)2Cys6 transcription factor [Aspergillus novofumigatus IBT 16806]|uniref:Putative C6 transcription factor n=1 Tax=Aspergillus novofumigatus (strain IBT 16806) TaxID=1392255 RepID=A0A2I1BTB8_ASPN1|nr:putative C6 transcription factor [Aspergillus novofumigatus IBT 16806]PKX88640.1 putative C6 transcription factor [Aspergillus novofumigatus IBT 16806]